MKFIKVAIAGYGFVGRSLTDLILAEREYLAREKGLCFIVTAVADAGGIAICPAGLPLDKLHTIAWDTGSVACFPEYGQKGITALESIELSDAELMVECTTSDYRNAEPALTHVMQALALGMNVALANKGPLALHSMAIKEAVKRYRHGLAFSCAAGTGLEVLPLLSSLGSAGDLLGIRGILNATSQFILRKMEQGYEFNEAVIKAQLAGIAEKDPTLDIQGYDSAVKLLLLCNHAWDGVKTIRDVQIQGIDKLEVADVREARDRGLHFNLVAEAAWEEGDYRMRVLPLALKDDDPLLQVSEGEKVVELATRRQGSQLLFSKAGSSSVAGSLLSDMIRLSLR